MSDRARQARARGVMMLAAFAVAACADAPGQPDPPPEPPPAHVLPPRPPPLSPAASPPAAPPGGRSGCIRGGSTPAEVRAAMGEPDSIVGGWWIYGRTQIFFGYGVVQDFINAGNLATC